jgi:hypothetical protein
MGNLIRFPGSGRSSAPDDQPRAITFARECDLIEKAIASVPTMSPQEAETAARNLTDLLDLSGLRLVDVAGAVEEWCTDGVPAKRLDKVMLPRQGALSSEEYAQRIASRRSRLQRRAKSYRRVGVALASRMNGRLSWQQSEILVRLFRGTRIDRVLQHLVNENVDEMAEPENCWHELSRRLHEVAAWVAREVGLKEHQRLIASTPGSYDPTERKCRPNRAPLLKHGPLNGNFEVWEEWPPVPSVLLFEELLGDSVQAVLTRSTNDELVGSAVGTDNAEKRVRAKVWREIRLAIGPADAVEETSPLFEVRTRVDVADGDVPLELVRSWLYLPSDSVQIMVNGECCEMELELPPSAPCGKLWEELLAWPRFSPDTRGALQPEHNYAAWRLITPELCAELLNKIPSGSGSNIWLRYEPPKRPTLAPEASIGAAVEVALLAPDGPRLDLILLNEARELVQKVKTYVDERRKEATAMHLGASMRWKGIGEGERQ